MRDNLTDDEVRQYRDHGFVAVPDLLGAADLTRWREAVGVATEQAPRVGTEPLPAAVDAAAAARRQARRDQQARINHEFRNLWRQDGTLRELLFDSPLGDLVAQLTGFAEVRLFFDRALRKPGFGEPTPFHIDGAHWSFDEPAGVTAWFALDAVTPENGCMYYYPGSHRRDRRQVKRVGAGIGAFVRACPDLADTEPVPCPLPAGGVVFHHSLVVHGAGANMTPAGRRAMTVAFMSAEATYNGRQSLLDDAQASVLRPGDRVADDIHHPVLPRPAVASG